MKRNGKGRMFAAAALSAALLLSGTAHAADGVQVDGDLSEWGAIAQREGQQADVSYWKVCRDEAGNVYLAVSLVAANVNVGYDWSIGITLNENGREQSYPLGMLQWHSGKYVQKNLAGDAPGPCYVEAMYPASLLARGDGTFTFQGQTLTVDELPLYEEEEVDDTPPVYQGITVDGSFKDWDAVEKTPITCPNPAHPDCLSEVAMVFDGDMVYFYIHEGEGTSSASGAGTHSNGRFAVTTDLGRVLQFQLNRDGTVSGVDGAQCARFGKQWEVAIPASELPNYLKSLNFGLYLAEPVIEGVENLDGSDSGGSFSGIVYDGEYEDWEYYPHTEIQYATPGTQISKPDGEGALYAKGSKLYGHVLTEMQPHLEEAGGEFTQAVTIRLNGDLEFYPRVVAVDAEGNINWDPQRSDLANGDYEFYIVDTQGWASASNINELKEQGNALYGKMHVTVGDRRDEMEFEMDLIALAEKFGIKASDIKLIEARFGRIGQQWISTAGTSTGTWLGIGACLAVTGGVLLHEKRRREAAV